MGSSVYGLDNGVGISSPANVLATARNKMHKAHLTRTWEQQLILLLP